MKLKDLFTKYLQKIKLFFLKNHYELENLNKLLINKLESKENELMKIKNEIKSKEEDLTSQKVKGDYLREKIDVINKILTAEEVFNIPITKYEEFNSLISEFNLRLNWANGMIYLETEVDKKEFIGSIKKEYKDYENLLINIYKRLTIKGNKSIVISGQFSSGKSSFLNKLFNLKLPVKITRTTAVPTYIFYSDKNNIKIENYNQCIYTTEDETILKKFEYDSDSDGIAWSNLINRIHYGCNTIDKHGVTFIDLPGYSGSEMDYKISIKEALSADGVLFFPSLEKGDFTKEDINFMKLINEQEIPILIILSQIDTMPFSKVNTIELKMIESLNKNKIDFESFIKYSTNRNLSSELLKIVKKSELVMKKYFEKIKNVQPEFEDLNNKLTNSIKNLQNDIKVFNYNESINKNILNYLKEYESIVNEMKNDFDSYLDKGWFSDDFSVDSFIEDYELESEQCFNNFKKYLEKNENLNGWEVNLYILSMLAGFHCVQSNLYCTSLSGSIKKENLVDSKYFLNNLKYIRNLSEDLFSGNPEKVEMENIEINLNSIQEDLKSLKKQILNKYKELFKND